MTKIISTLKRYLYNIQLKKKILWIYFFLIIIPLGFFTMFSFLKVSRAIQSQTLYTASKTFENTVHLTEETLTQLENTVGILSNDPLVYKIASHDSSGYPLSDQLVNADSLRLTFNHLKDITYADNIRLYVGNDFLYSEQSRDILHLKTISDADWYHSLINDPNASIWFDPGLDNQLSLAHVIYDPNNVSELLAVLRVDIEKEQLLKIISKTPVTENSSLLLMHHNQPLLSSGADEKTKPYKNLFKEVTLSEPDTWNLTTISNEKIYLNYSRLLTTDWNMISAIPYDDVFALNKSIFSDLLVIVFLIGTFSYILAYTISNSSLKRISKLTDSLQKIQTGDFDVILTPQGNDEIGQMMLAFNHMVDNINVLMKEKEESGKEIKSLELKALQAQINPHFLYNSLDLINCIAIEHDIPQIMQMVNSLAKFYKISLSEGNDTISLAKELAHTSLYINIQNLRFEDRINLVVTADETLLDYKITKIVLQPLVENSIIHGIFEKEVQSGSIEIKLAEEGNDIVLKVIDDGIGMSPESLAKNFQFDPLKNDHPDHDRGYGVRNVNDRLQLAYGPDYGMTCTSKLGSGTTVSLRIPKLI